MNPTDREDYVEVLMKLTGEAKRLFHTYTGPQYIMFRADVGAILVEAIAGNKPMVDALKEIRRLEREYQ